MTTEVKSSEYASILLIQVWMGPWPRWFNLFLETCARNPTIDWLFVHDADAPAKIPGNCTFQKNSLRGFANAIKERLGVPVNLRQAYKIGDLKPLFGILYPEYVNRYDFWGYCDNDIMWGDIRKFITDGLLANYDIISSCRCCIIGAFSIFRTVPLTLNLFRQVPGWQDVLLSTEIKHLDEQLLDQAASQCESKGLVRVLRVQLGIHDVGSAEWLLWARRLEEEAGRDPNGFFWLEGAVKWEDGSIIHAETGQEAMFFHFMTWKRHWRIPQYTVWRNCISGWRLDQEGIHIWFREYSLFRMLYRMRFDVPNWGGAYLRRLMGALQPHAKRIMNPWRRAFLKLVAAK